MTITDLQERIITVFSDLNFDSRRHLYYVQGENLPSVSSLVESHAEKFDADYWAPICAPKEKMTVHEIIHHWQTINQEACDLGHETHDFLERYTGLESPSTPQQVAGIKFFKDILIDYEIICRELRMYSRKYSYAGTADLLLRDRRTGELVLADYKTNKDLFKTYGFLKTPFNTLECHPYNKYQIQLSYYQLMLEEAGCCITKRLLVYLKADETYRIFPLIDLTSHLTTHLQSRVKQKVYDHW